MTLHLLGGSDNPYETAKGLSYMQLAASQSSCISVSALRLGYLTMGVHASVQVLQTI